MLQSDQGRFPTSVCRNGLELLLDWPRLQKTLNDFKDGRSPPLSGRCPEFVGVLSSVLASLTYFYVSSVPVELLHIY